MLAGIYYGAQYGNSITSILLNVPGTPSSAVTALDGYPLCKQGKAGPAIFITTAASFFGSCFAILCLAFFSPIIAEFALNFGSVEYFSLMVFGLITASVVAPGSQLKGIAMVIVGLVLGLVGTDITTATFRFTFGFIELTDGITLVAVAMGRVRRDRSHHQSQPAQAREGHSAEPAHPRASADLAGHAPGP
ncbi:MAG: tripartite tricarboxylate transporter permease [Paracoccaceae bacterium]